MKEANSIAQGALDSAKDLSISLVIASLTEIATSNETLRTSPAHVHFSGIVRRRSS